MHRIAVIPGDRIGKEVVSEGVKCMNALCEVFEDLDKRGASVKSIVTL